MSLELFENKIFNSLVGDELGDIFSAALFRADAQDVHAILQEVLALDSVVFGILAHLFSHVHFSVDLCKSRKHELMYEAKKCVVICLFLLYQRLCFFSCFILAVHLIFVLDFLIAQQCWRHRGKTPSNDLPEFSCEGGAAQFLPIHVSKHL